MKREPKRAEYRSGGDVTGWNLAAAIIWHARKQGWTVAHFPAIKTDFGWRTPVGADGKGWPDLVLVRDRVLFREVKGGLDKLRPDQEKWQSALALAGGNVGVWRMKDWDAGAILEELARD